MYTLKDWALFVQKLWLQDISFDKWREDFWQEILQHKKHDFDDCVYMIWLCKMNIVRICLTMNMSQNLIDILTTRLWRNLYRYVHVMIMRLFHNLVSVVICIGLFCRLLVFDFAAGLYTPVGNLKGKSTDWINIKGNKSTRHANR